MKEIQNVLIVQRSSDNILQLNTRTRTVERTHPKRYTYIVLWTQTPTDWRVFCCFECICAPSNEIKNIYSSCQFIGWWLSIRNVRTQFCAFSLRILYFYLSFSWCRICRCLSFSSFLLLRASFVSMDNWSTDEEEKLLIKFNRKCKKIEWPQLGGERQRN